MLANRVIIVNEVVSIYNQPASNQAKKNAKYIVKSVSQLKEDIWQDKCHGQNEGIDDLDCCDDCKRIGFDY